MFPRPKPKKCMALRQLHLTPYFVYMVNSTHSASSSYVLQLWKDQTKIGEINQVPSTPPSPLHKYSTVSFKGVYFIFDVQALFMQRSQATIQLKLSEDQGEGWSILQQFQLHLLYYNYEFSNSRFFKQKQNSIGTINHYILNYSFSAIYGEPLQSLLFRKAGEQKGETLFEDLFLGRKKLKYGEMVTDQNRNQHIDTIFLLESVIQKEGSSIQTNASYPPDQPQKFINNSTFIEDMDEEEDNARNVKIQTADNLPFEAEDSNMVDKELASEILTISKSIAEWLLILLSIALVCFLMSPNKKI